MSKLRKISFRTDNRTYEAHTEYFAESSRHGGLNTFFFVRVPQNAEPLIADDKRDEAIKGFTKHFHNRGKYYHVVWAKTEAEVEAKWREFIRWFEKIGTATEKVILYKISFDSRTVGSKYKREAESRSSSRWHNEDKEEAKITLVYYICEKVKFGSVVTYYEEKNGKREKVTQGNNVKDKVEISSWGGTDYVEIPYTPEAEQFFKQLYEGMEKLMENFMKYMGSKNTMIKTIANNQKLLK